MKKTDMPFELKIDQKVPMRDGVNLSADLWMPTGKGPWPALLLRTIYDNQEPRYIDWTVRFVERGYVVVLQDSRGRHDSDGDWDPYMCELEDGFDTHEWIGKQPWCDGGIGTFGMSYPGFTQTLPATLRSKYLKALVPIASQQDNFGHHRVDGVVALSTAQFFANMIGRTMQRESLNRMDWMEIHTRLPLINSLDHIGDSPFYRGIIEHETYSEWWDRYSLRSRYHEVEAPAYFMTGWYDSLLHETLKVFNGWTRKARTEKCKKLTKLVIGPWSHQIAPWGKSGNNLGPNGEYEGVSFGSSVQTDIVDIHLRWYEARLKGINNGIDDEPPIQLFVMGSNSWRFENEWPLARTKWTRLYLDSSEGANSGGGDGTLNLTPRDNSSADTFDYDPANPVLSWGGQYQSQELAGPRDRRQTESRGDVLVYTSAALENNLEVTGPISATIVASTDGPSTDFTATLVDVWPDGRAIILCEGISRSNYLNPEIGPSLIDPGRPYTYQIDMWDTSNLFKKGHRIRLEISSSNFPRYERNLNTGEPAGTSTEMRVAHQVVLHDPENPSYLTLPVIPQG